MLSIYNAEGEESQPNAKGEESQPCSIQASPLYTSPPQHKTTNYQTRCKRASAVLDRPTIHRLHPGTHLRLRPFRPCLLVSPSREWLQVMRRVRSAILVARLNISPSNVESYIYWQIYCHLSAETYHLCGMDSRVPGRATDLPITTIRVTVETIHFSTLFFDVALLCTECSKLIM